MTTKSLDFMINVSDEIVESFSYQTLQLCMIRFWTINFIIVVFILLSAAWHARTWKHQNMFENIKWSYIKVLCHTNRIPKNKKLIENQILWR